MLSVSAYAERDKNHKCSPQTLATMKSKAEKGDVVELYNMGNHYRYGYCSYSEDKNKAMELYEKAAVKGYIPAMKDLFKLCYGMKNYTKCQSWCNKLLEINPYDADAYYYLSLCEEKEGKVCVGNCALAAMYGSKYAMNKLGCIYYEDKLYKEAYEAWVKAWCSAPDETITNNLIYCCLLPGNGCKKDYIAAARLYKLFFYDNKNYDKHVSDWNKVKAAADAGDAKACYAWYILNEDKKYFEKALAAKVPDALFEKELETREIYGHTGDEEEKVEAVYQMAMKNKWYAPLIYWAAEVFFVDDYGPAVRVLLDGGNESFTDLPLLNQYMFLHYLTARNERDFYWEFIYPKILGEEYNGTKEEKIDALKYYQQTAEVVYKSGICKGASILSWIYSEEDLIAGNIDEAFMYASIATNMEEREDNPNLINFSAGGLTSAYVLGKCYYEGKGAKKNRVAALSYLLNSERSEAKALLNRIYRMAPLSKEAGVVQDIPLADYYLSESSKSGAELLEKLQNR